MGTLESLTGSMFATRRRAIAVALAAALLLSVAALFALNAASAATSRSVATLGMANVENFNDLSNSAASSTLPTGFVLSETGTGADTTYSVGNGTSNTADTYSFGPTSGTDRALGSIRSNVLSMIYGAGFVNDTGATITTLDVSYVGEQWRLGATDRADSLEFAYSTNATSLTDTSATFTAVPALHFSSPVTTGTVGMLVGNQTGNQTAKTATISGLNIPDDSTFFFRWTDGNAAGADDGLAVDNLSLTAFASDLTVCASGCNFTSIQAAINAAAPGATISVEDGTYGESVTVNKDNLTINGANSGRVHDASDRDAENNWWGCNEGPTYNSAPANDCNSIQVIAGSPADVDSNPHLTLAANANPAKIRSAGGSSAITASLKKGDAAIAADFPNTSISFVANSGDATTASTIAPGSADTNGGAAMTTLTSGSMGIVSVTATLDNETVLTSVDVNDTPTAEDNEYSVDEDETLTAADLDGTDEDPNDTNNDGVLFNDTDTENDPLTVADGDDADTDESGEVDPVSGPTNGTLILREDGSFAYEPNADFNGEDEFTYAVTDGTSRSEATVDIIVHPVNEAPDAGDDDVTIAEDGLPSGDPLTYDLSTLVTDEEAEIANANTNTFDYAYVSGLTDGDDPAAIPDPVNGVTTITGDEGEITVEGSTLTYTPEDDFNTGTDSFDITYNATDKGDPHGCTDNDDSTNTDGCAAPLSNEGVLTVTVTPVNDAPSFEFEADDPNQTVAENSESPPNENLERFHIVEGFIDPDSISPGPADESAQNVGFTVENDNNDLFETAPVIDEDGDLAYQLAENANGIATVEVVAVDTGSTTNPDDDNESEAQTFTITVTPVNTAPTANTVTASGFEDPSEPIEIDLGAEVDDTETANADLTYSITGLDSEDGEITEKMDNGNPVPGVFVFDPVDDFNTGDGKLDLEYTVTDRGDPDNCANFTTAPAQGCENPLASEPGAVEITVHPVNDEPIAEDDTAETDEEDPIVIDVLANDTAGPATATDENDGQTLGVNADHLANNQPDNGDTVVVTQAMIDDDDALEADDPDKLGLAAEDEGSILYTPDENYADSTTPDSFKYQACDDGQSYVATTEALVDASMCTEADVDVTVDPVNDKPLLTLEDPADQEVAENSMGSNDTEDRTHTVTPFASGDTGGGADEDGQNITFEAVAVDESGDPISNGSPLFEIQPTIANDGTLTYTLAENKNGVATVEVVATDDGAPPASSDAQTFAITVTPENSRPTSNGVPASEATTNEGEPLTINLNDKVADVETDDEDLIYEFEGLTSQSGNLADGISGDEGTISRKLEDGDPVPGVFVFTPAENYNTGDGTLDISYTVTDLGDPEECDTANATAEPHPQGCAAPETSYPAGTIFIDVTPANTAPTTNLAISSGEEDQNDPIEIYLDAVVNDEETDNADLTYSITGLDSADGAISPKMENGNPVPGVFVFDLAPNFNTGEDTLDLEYTVTDRGDPDDCDDTDAAGEDTNNAVDNCDGPETSSGDIEITVTPINDEPTFMKGDNEIVLEDSKNPDETEQPDNAHTVPGWATDISAGAANESGQTLTFTAAVPEAQRSLFATGGLPAVDPTSGNLTYTLAAHKNGEAEVTVVLTDDGSGGADGNDNTSGAQTFTIAVRQVNDNPIADDESATTNEDTPKIIDVLDGDKKGPDAATDESGQTLAVDAAHLAGNQPDNGEAEAITQAMIAADDALASDDPAKIGLDSEDEGSVLYTPDPNYNNDADSLDAFTYKVCDDGQSGNVADADLANDPKCDEGDVSVAVTPINDPPVANGASRTVDEDNVLSVHLFNDAISNASNDKIASDVDLSREGDTLIVANATQGANGKVRCNPNGACTYTPNKDFNGSDSFTYTVRDAAGATDTAAISVSIAPVPDAPVANGDPGEGGETLETDRDTPKVIDVLDNDTDAEGDTLSVTGLQSPTDEGGTATVITPAVISASNGSLTSDDEGKILYEPNDGFFGDDTFTYKAKDSTGLVSAPATVTIAVNDVENTKPEGAIDEYSMDEGGTLTADDADGETTPADANDDGILANDDDDDTIFVADADAIEDGVQPESAPRHGTLELEEDGTFVYTPDDPDFFGEDEFTYKADDRRGNANLSDETTVTITVENAPDNPVANNDPENAEAYEVNEDGTLTVNAANGLIANDTDADNLTGPANAGLTVADKDGDASGIQPETAPTKGSLTLNANGSFTYTPNANFNGSDSFTYKAKDAEGNLSDAVEVSISVAPVADAPIARLDNATTDEDTPKVINVLANDGNPDGGPLTLTIAEGGAPDHGTAIVITEDGADKNKIRYTPSLHFHGRDSLTYEVCDSGGRCDQAQVRITVTPVNDPPEAANDGPYDADDDEPLTVSAGDGLLANDTDVDNEGNSNAGLTVADGDNDSENGITPVTGPTKGSLTLNANGAFEYTPNAAATGTDTFTYKATDGTATSNEATVAITINTVNKKPTAAPDEYSVGEDETLTADGTGTQPINGVLANDDDPIDDDLTATLVEGGGPEFGALDLESDGTFVYTPDDDFNGDDSFEYRADDGGAKNNLSDPAIVTITVEAENDAPTAGAASAATDENTPKNIDVLAANGTGDVDGDTLEVIVPEGRGPSHGTFRIVEVGGKDVVRYTPSTNYNGNDSFQYRVSDGTLQSPLATVSITVSITVNPVNSPSTAENITRSMDEDASPLSINLADHASDIETPDNALAFTLTQSPAAAQGTTNLTDSNLTFTPKPNFNGVVEMKYSATDDGDNGAAPKATEGTISITVNPVNDAPTAGAVNETVLEDTPKNINLLA